MHHLYPVSRRNSLSLRIARVCQDLVRFFALLRIKPHAPPLVRPPSIPLSFNLAVVLPGGVLNALAALQRTYSSLQLALIVYGVDYQVSNPVCSPRFRASVSVTGQRAAFASGVPPYIYAFHRYTWNSTLLSCTQVSQFPMHTMVEPLPLHQT